MILRYVSFLFLLASCSDDTPKYIDGDDLIPPSPPFWEYFTVHGFDEDKDLVRDDIELWINDKFDDSNIRKAAKFRVSLQYRFFNSRNTEDAMNILRQFGIANECIHFVGDYRKDEIRTIDLYNKFYNNSWRKKERIHASKFVPSHSGGHENQNRLQQIHSCPFKVENPDKLWQAYFNDGSYKINASMTERDEYEKMIKGIK